jgi:hypothetical protein
MILLDIALPTQTEIEAAKRNLAHIRASRLSVLYKDSTASRQFRHEAA